MGNGLDLVREARARGDRPPVLVLPARDRTEQRIAGPDPGADHYLGTPLAPAAVQAALPPPLRPAHAGRAESEGGGGGW